MDLDQFKWKNRLLFIFAPQDDDLFFQAIRRVNEDPALYQEMYLEPMFPYWESNTPGFKMNKFMDSNRFINWWEKNVMKGE